MGMPILLYGKSGSGKSRSLKFFGEEEILLVNVEGKDLPFRSKFKYVCKTDSVDTIIEQCKKMPCKVCVIDDAGYLMKPVRAQEVYDEISHILKKRSKKKIL